MATAGVYPVRTRIGIPEFAADFGFTHEQVQSLFDCNPESEFNAALALAVEDARATAVGYVVPTNPVQGDGVPTTEEVPANPPDVALNTGVGAEIVARSFATMDAISKHRFWSALKKRMEEKRSSVRARKPNSENSIEFGIGRSSFHLGGWLQSTNTESWIGVYLRIGAPHAAAHFELLQQQRGEIEQELGKLEWRPPVPNKRKEPLIQLLDTNADPMREEDRPNQIDWMVSTLEDFNNTFRPRLKSLNASDWRPDNNR